MDRLFLTGGVRYTHDKQKDVYLITAANRATAPGPLAKVPFPDINNSKVTPRAVIRYELSNASSVYASFSQGYKSAIEDVGSGLLSNIYIKPETIDAFEAGYKYATRELTFNLSGYYYNYKNQQITSARFVNGLPQSLVQNAAASHIYGLDGDLRYQLNDRFVVNLAGSWNHARYRKFPNAPRYLENPVVPANPSCPSLVAGTQCVVFQNASGNHMIRAPDWSGTAQATYTLDLAGGKLDLSANLQYTSTIYFDNFQQFKQSSYALLGLRAEFTTADERWSFGVGANNVTDKAYLAVVSPNSGGIAENYGAPRTIEGFIRVKI